MNIVDVIYPYKIFDPNGASCVVRLLYESQNIFNKAGILCRFHSMDVKGNKILSPFEDKLNQTNVKGNGDTPKVLVKKNLVKIAKTIVSKVLRQGASVAFLTIYRGLMIPCKKIAQEFIETSDNDSATPVFIHDIFTCYYYLKYRKYNRPVLLVLHNNGETFKMLAYYYPEIKGSWVMRKFDRIERYVLSQIDKLVFVSQNSRFNFLAKHPNFPSNKVYYVYNGIPDKDIIKDQNRNGSKLELCCVASITDRKGQEIIIDALGKLISIEREKIHITFVGDGYLRNKLENKVKEKGISSSVDFVGIQSDVDSYLAKSDIFILTSYDEGLPMSIIEAQRAKLPIISTSVAGIPEMIEQGKSGLLIKPSVEELLPILKNISKYDWRMMGERSYEIYKEKFTGNNMVYNYAKILNEMIINPL